MENTRSTASVQLASVLESLLQRQGYTAGSPPHLTAWSEEIDAGVAASAVCPASCGVVGLKARPYHRGQSYRVVLACPVCNAGEEL